MQNKINSSLLSAATVILLIWYPIYLISQDFNIEQISNLRESIIEYKYRIFLVIIIHLLLLILEKLPFKKSKFVKLFFLRRKPIITLLMFIYPLLPDFGHRFGQIYEGNVTDFYAIYMPIFIMFIITSLLDTWDPDFLKEMKDTLSIKLDTNHKTNSLVLKASKFTIISAYAFLFMLLAWWICLTRKVNSGYENTFLTIPLMFFCFFFGMAILLHTVLNNKSDIKASTGSDITNNRKSKSNKEEAYKNIKVNFK